MDPDQTAPTVSSLAVPGSIPLRVSTVATRTINNSIMAAILFPNVFYYSKAKARKLLRWTACRSPKMTKKAKITTISISKGVWGM